MNSSPSKTSDEAAHDAGEHSSGLPQDYDEYRERMDRQAEAFFDWHSRWNYIRTHTYLKTRMQSVSRASLGR